jgi:hypothetical protein
MTEKLTQPRLLKLCASLPWCDFLLIPPEKIGNGHTLEVSNPDRKLSSVDLPFLIPRPFSGVSFG